MTKNGVDDHANRMAFIELCENGRLSSEEYAGIGERNFLMLSAVIYSRA